MAIFVTKEETKGISMLNSAEVKPPLDSVHWLCIGLQWLSIQLFKLCITKISNAKQHRLSHLHFL